MTRSQPETTRYLASCLQRRTVAAVPWASPQVRPHCSRKLPQLRHVCKELRWARQAITRSAASQAVPNIHRLPRPACCPLPCETNVEGLQMKLRGS